MIQLKYFASLRDALGCGDEQIEFVSNVSSVESLRIHLAARGDIWTKQLLNSSVLAAVNQEVAVADTPVRDGDEVAFFPPVTGG